MTACSLPGSVYTQISAVGWEMIKTTAVRVLINDISNTSNSGANKQTSVSVRLKTPPPPHTHTHTDIDSVCAVWVHVCCQLASHTNLRRWLPWIWLPATFNSMDLGSTIDELQTKAVWTWNQTHLTQEECFSLIFLEQIPIKTYLEAFFSSIGSPSETGVCILAEEQTGCGGAERDCWKASTGGRISKIEKDLGLIKIGSLFKEKNLPYQVFT